MGLNLTFMFIVEEKFWTENPEAGLISSPISASNYPFHLGQVPLIPHA